MDYLANGPSLDYLVISLDDKIDRLSGSLDRVVAANV